MKRALFIYGASCLVAALLLVSSATTLPAQRGNCWQCTLNQGTQTYSCISGTTLGHTSCEYYGGQGCVVGSICGYYRRLADGSVADTRTLSARRAMLGAERQDVAPFVKAAASSPRAVERGCNDTIIRRVYDRAEARRLARSTRVIRA